MRIVTVAATASGLANGAYAQAFRSDVLAIPGVVSVEAQASNPETVRLLTGLAKIESDLQLGMLFLRDGMTSLEGSHFTDPRKETLPEIKEGLSAAGVEDFQRLLLELEAGGDKQTVTKSYGEVIAAVMMARAVLHPSDRDLIQSIVDQTKAVVAEINANGPTDVANYQDAWAMLIVARTQLDLLVRNPDPAVAKSAGDMALALDDVILAMPDPNQLAPVAFDPAPITAAIEHLEALAGSV